MSPTPLLPGIVQNKVRTDRLEVAYLEAGSGDTPIVLVHGNTASSLFFQDFMLVLAATGRYKIFAPDMRGYGDTEALRINATRGVRDFSDDLYALVQALGLPAFHLFGWSLGGNVVMQYAIDHSNTLRSLTLQAPGSPFGFGGTKGANGAPIWPDFAGSGGGTANPEFVKRIGQGDRGSDQLSPRTVMNTFYFKPPFRVAPDREEIYVTSILSCKVAEGIYPGDMTASNNWPNVAPGVQGPITHSPRSTSIRQHSLRLAINRLCYGYAAPTIRLSPIPHCSTSAFSDKLARSPAGPEPRSIHRSP